MSAVFLFTLSNNYQYLHFSLHDALPILTFNFQHPIRRWTLSVECWTFSAADGAKNVQRSEEHTSELQSHSDLVCRLLLEKKNLSLIPAAQHRRPGRRTHNAYRARGQEPQ